MNRFNIVKTIQLILTIGITIASLLVVFLNRDVYTLIATEPGVRTLAIFIWVVLGLSFLFMYYDFTSYTDLKRENAELDNAVYSDALTGIANRYSLDMYLGRFIGKPLPEDMGCATIDMTNLSQINKEKGHGQGDAAIRNFSEILLDAAGRSSFIGRNGGNKFVVIFRNCSDEMLESFLSALKRDIETHNSEHPDMEFRYSAGTAFDEGDDVISVTELVALSDRRAAENI